MINRKLELEKIFLSLGYTSDDYIKIIDYYSIIHFDYETLKMRIVEIYNYLLNNYSKKEVLQITKKYPGIYSLSIENINKKIEGMILLSYSKEEVIKMTKILPTIYGISIENINKKIEDMISLGYSKEEVIKMTKVLPTIYSYSIENINKKIEDLVSLGYSKEEVIKMSKFSPAIYCYSIDNIKQKIEDIVLLGYSKEEVIKMIKTLPTIYGLSIDNIRQKIEFYDSINMHELPIIDSKKLMQSVSLSYARYMYFKDNGIIVTMDNYKKLFYYSNKQFKRTYGLTNQELIQKYNYEDYLKEQEHARNI